MFYVSSSEEDGTSESSGSFVPSAEHSLQSTSSEEEDDSTERYYKEVRKKKKRIDNKAKQISLTVDTEKEIVRSYEIKYIPPVQLSNQSDELFLLEKDIYDFIYKTEDYRSRAGGFSRAIIDKYRTRQQYSPTLENIFSTILNAFSAVEGNEDRIPEELLSSIERTLII